MTNRFTCGICAKIFDNQKSQNRHAIYCRKRAKDPPRSRRKACSICSKAKTQCDTGFPKCSRCSKRNLTCTYERGRRTTQSSILSDPLEQNNQNSISNIDVDLRSSVFSDTRSSLQPYIGESTYNLASGSPVSDFAGLSPSRLSRQNSSWDTSRVNGTDELNGILPHMTNTNIGTQDCFQDLDAFPEYLMPEYNPRYTLETPSPAPLITTILRDSTDTPLFNGQPRSTSPLSFDAMNSLNVEIIPRPPTAFQPRKIRSHRSSLNRHYVVCALRSYPFLILQNKISTPPFIHPQTFELNGDDPTKYKTLPEPLAVCSGIMHMWSVKNKYNSVFIWNAIRTEQAKLSAECLQYDDFNTVAALQAICIYLLLRLSKEESEEVVGFDDTMIATMLKLARRTSGFGRKYGGGGDSSVGRPTWEGWILAESLRRTLITLFLVNTFFDITIPTSLAVCNSNVELTSVALPCSKKLWHAATRSKWEEEYLAHMNGPIGGRQLTYGDLMAFQSRVHADVLPKGDLFDCWFSQVDEFGMLVIAAASVADGD